MFSGPVGGRSLLLAPEKQWELLCSHRTGTGPGANKALKLVETQNEIHFVKPETSVRVPEDRDVTGGSGHT